MDAQAAVVFDGPGPEIPGELQDAVQLGAVLKLLAEKGVRRVPAGDGGGAVGSRLAKTAAQSARARKAGRMRDRYAKASRRSVPEISREGASMSRAARDSARVSGDVSVTGRWALKRWGKGLSCRCPS